MAPAAVSVVLGTVINIHNHGATVRLEDGSLAAAPAADVAANRAAYEASHAERTPLALVVERRGRHATVLLQNAGAPERAAAAPAPVLVDPAFETQLNAYLKSTEEWAPPDRPAPAERHFIRKKRREAIFEARKQAT